MKALERLAQTDAVDRLRGRDATLFSSDAAVQATVADRLGWTALSSTARDLLPELDRLAEEARAEGVTDVALLGMGGSSLASLVTFGILDPRAARLHVLDTVSPATIRHALSTLDPARTIYVVASKSGGTVEPNALYAIFREAADSVLGVRAAGQRFMAVTDPGTSLERLAREEGFRACLFAPRDVGGRFSALTVFGLLPAVLTGVDLRLLIESAAAAEVEAGRPLAENPAASLAAWMCDARAAGADKLTLVTSPGLRSFGLWVEQLVAESLGKHGTGIIPVVELADTPRGLGPDRALAVVRTADDAGLAAWAESQRATHPVFDIVLADAYDLAAEFVRWEHAVAFCGVVLGVNPFDEPNVAEAKAATGGVLDGSAAPPEPQGAEGGAKITFAGGLSVPGGEPLSLTASLEHVFGALGPGDYLAMLAYVPDDGALLAPLAEVVPKVAAATGTATCLEIGPRYLHSTGQLHKGGPNSGVFVMITTRDPADVVVPGQPWSLRTLHRAQAEGDLVTLSAHARRVLRIDLQDASSESLGRLVEAIAQAAQASTESGA